MNANAVTANPISLIFPRSSTTDELLAALNDVHAFFSKWPAQPEVFVPFLPPVPMTEKLQNRPPGKGLQLLNNAGLGFGAAVKEALKRSKADFAFVLDLPLEFPLAEVFQAWMEFETKPEVDIVVGSRRHPESGVLHTPPAWQWRIDSWLNERLHKNLGTAMRDFTTSFYGFRVDRVRLLSDEVRDTGFSFPARLVRKARLARLGVSEKPSTWNPAPTNWSRFAMDQWNLLKMTVV